MYYFASDERPGDTKGQNSGNVRFVISPVGDAVRPGEVGSPAVALAATPTPTPAVVRVATPSPTLPPRPDGPSELQEIATIEDYSASQFYPNFVVVVKDIPLNLYVTRLHREHVNAFSIEPFLFSSSFHAPGTMGIESLMPDRSGEFWMRNEGHGFQTSFIVADTEADAKELVGERGMQEFSLIHDLEGGLIAPSRVVVQKDIPVKVYNTSLKGSDRLTISPFYTPESTNIRDGTITTFEFVPDAVGEYTIRYDNSDVTGTLVVEEQ